jgi:hypothetical protein
MSKLMTCEEFADYMQDDLATLIDEHYWEGGPNANDFFVWLQGAALADCVTLTDLDTFDYEGYYEVEYKCAEKGLS